MREAIDVLHADRLRHGIRSAEDPGLLRELAARGIVCDVCPVSNVSTGAVDSLAEHPLPLMLRAGVRCSISTDDPAMFGTDLAHEYRVAARLGETHRAAGDVDAARDTWECAMGIFDEPGHPHGCRVRARLRGLRVS